MFPGWTLSLLAQARPTSHHHQHFQVSNQHGLCYHRLCFIILVNTAGCFKHHTELRDFLGSKDAGFYLGLFSGEFPHEAFMYLVVVNPDYHRMGAGTRMYQDSLDKCTSAKRYAVSAIMKNKDLEAQAFHGALGFEVKELEFDWVPRDTSIIVKRKQLPVPVHVDWKWAQ